MTLVRRSLIFCLILILGCLAYSFTAAHASAPIKPRAKVVFDTRPGKGMRRVPGVRGKPPKTKVLFRLTTSGGRLSAMNACFSRAANGVKSDKKHDKTCAKWRGEGGGLWSATLDIHPHACNVVDRVSLYNLLTVNLSFRLNGYTITRNVTGSLAPINAKVKCRVPTMTPNHSLATKNNQAIATIRMAETILSSYFNRHNENFCSVAAADQDGSNCGTDLTASLNINPNNDNPLVWVNDSGADGTIPLYGFDSPSRSGDFNDPKRVFIKNIVAGRYGGVSFCVGSKGSKNYCGVWLANAPGQFWTLASKTGKSNLLAGVLIFRSVTSSWVASCSAPVSPDGIITSGLKS